MKVFIAPTYRHTDNADGGIRRVSEALWRYLPDYGIEPTDNPAEADLFNLHGASLIERPGVPVVASNHGLYWDDYKFPRWAEETNREVVKVMSRARAITAPSHWVAHAITRGMLVTPHVIYHGVDVGEWEHSETPDNYVLWNKARKDAVSNPDDMQTLAGLMRGQRFITTIGQQTNNVEVTGIMPLADMRPLIQRAGVYLCTARETFGIGTLEAMASGVPVVGWDYGGQSEIITEGETGYLAPYGNYDALATCVSRALQERKRLSENAKADVLSRWLWPDKVERYAGIFKGVLEEHTAPQIKVSVVVTCHNLAKYLPAALDSILAQTLTDWECIIIDDMSTDDTESVVKSYLEHYKIKYYRSPHNLKLSGARNYGAEKAQGRYLIFLDADDMLDPQALELLSNALDRDITLHVASGHLDTINGDNPERSRASGWPPPHFDYHAQLAHLNQIPYASMWRREVFEAMGGYRRRAWRAEDAEMWIRVSSFGYRIAKVTEHPVLVYRFRSDSKSQKEFETHEDRDGDWTAWYPWRIAGNASDGSKLNKRGAKTPPILTPWGAQGTPPEGVRFWPVKHHQAPQVSVVIPCGPTHERYVIDAVESVMAQTFVEWEVIVVNDTGKAWEGKYHPLSGAPYARVIMGERRGPGAARNLGASAAKGECIVFLDADDTLLPQFLEYCMAEYRQSGRIVYTDYLVSRGTPGEPLESYQCEDWECSRYVQTDTGERLVGVLNRMHHSNCFLIPRATLFKAKGYNEEAPGHEDWDLQIRLETTGTCSVRLPLYGFVYRVHTGLQRVNSEDKIDEVRKWLHDTWLGYYQGVNEMPCGSCPGGIVEMPTLPAPAVDDTPPEDAVLIEYLGNEVSNFTIMMEGMSTAYKFGANEANRRKYVRTKDVGLLLSRNVAGRAEFQQVERPRPSAPAPLFVVPGKPPQAPLPDMSEYQREHA